MQREEGGTPAIVEAIRAGLVFQLKEAVGVDVIRAHEDGTTCERAVEAWQAEPAIEILGNLDAERLSIVSFVVRAPSGSYLHHNYVVALLNDLFGIQSRGGCSCAGPYGHRLLGIDLDRSHEFEREITRGCEGIKPGWVRVNFNYFLSEAVFDYVIEAVRLVARDGWRLLGTTGSTPTRGLWRHRDGPVEPPMRLRQITYDADGRMRYDRTTTTRPRRAVLKRHLDDGAALLREATPPELDGAPAIVSQDFEQLRWFELPPVPRRQVRSAVSSSVNSRDRIRKRTPSGASSEKPAPRPGTTSTVRWVCVQYSNCERDIHTGTGCVEPDVEVAEVDVGVAEHELAVGVAHRRRCRRSSRRTGGTSAGRCCRRGGGADPPPHR